MTTTEVRPPQDYPHPVPAVWRGVVRYLALPVRPQRLPLDLISSSAVDEEFETVSTQLLKRTQAMLNKYRLLLLEESRVG